MQLTTTADQSLNGYMVTPREDTGTPLGADVAYVGSWEIGADMKHLCGGVSIHYDHGNALWTTLLAECIILIIRELITLITCLINNIMVLAGS